MDPTPQSRSPEAGAKPFLTQRRRLFGGVATGVLLAVPAKTALGNSLCQTPSVMMSGGTSPSPGTEAGCSGGRSPGYWVQPQHAPNWTVAGATFPQFNGQIVECQTGTSDLDSDSITNPGTYLDSVFPGTPHVSLWEPLAMAPKKYTQLLRHLVAAWLNAGYFPDNYPLTQAQVVDMWVQLNTTGVYCPPSMGGSCGVNAWTKDDVKSYIENMYDINSNATNMCKASGDTTGGSTGGGTGGGGGKKK